MTKNKKRFSRRNRTKKSKKHIFYHKTVKPTIRSAEPKKEGSKQTATAEDNFIYIRNDLRLVLIVSVVILLVIVVLYFITRSINFKIFGLNI